MNGYQKKVTFSVKVRILVADGNAILRLLQSNGDRDPPSCKVDPCAATLDPLFKTLLDGYSNTIH